jgi:MFS transporter, PPP family, 3-phenylpropionic acid transporter
LKKIWPFSFYFWQYAGLASLSPYFVLYYQSQGFSGPQIGLLTGLSPLVTLVCAPLWTGLADATRQHRWVFTLTGAGTCLALVAFPVFRAFLPVLVIVLLYSVFNSPISSLADSATMTLLGAGRDKYGRVRMGGTLGLALAAPFAGRLVQRYGLTAAFWVCAGMYLMALGAGQNLWLSAEKIAAPTRLAIRSGSRALMTNPRWLLFLVAAFGGGLALVVSNTYLFAYFKELGAPETTMGFALSLSTVFELPVLFFGYRLLRWLKADRLFLLSLVIMSARMLLMAWAQTVTQALLVQLLAGLAFPMMWMGGVANAAENAPPGLSATAQGIFMATLLGVGCAAGGLAAGPILASFGAHTLFFVCGLTTLILAALNVLVGQLLPARP